jgi:hypothetical protein
LWTLLCSSNSTESPTFSKGNQKDVSKRRDDIVNPAKNVSAPTAGLFKSLGLCG